MRLYTKTGATQVDDPQYGTFTPDDNGAFEFPDPLGAKLHGRPEWETEDVRATRIATEELDRLRDPATLLAELRKMSEGQGAVTSLLAQALGLAPAAEASAVTPQVETPGPDGNAETPAEPAVKATSTRGRGGRAAKSAASNES